MIFLLAVRIVNGASYFGFDSVDLRTVELSYCSYGNVTSFDQCFLRYTPSLQCSRSNGIAIQCQEQGIILLYVDILLLCNISAIASCTSDNLFLINADGNVSTSYVYIKVVSGYLETCINGHPQTICDSDFSFIDSSVACKSMGFSSIGKLSDIIVAINQVNI